MCPRSFLLLIFVAASVGLSLCQGSLLGSLKIDCGAQAAHFRGLMSYWDTDEKYIKTGDNKAIPSENFNSVTELNTLRYFKKGKKNCYTLPAVPSSSYNVKASFYYGNYDERSKPPIFGLEIEANEWDEVVTSSTVAVYHEAILTARGHDFSVCLVRLKGKHGHPFINALEISPLSSNGMYETMNRDLTWFRIFRYRFGAGETVLGYPDPYSRVWESYTPSTGEESVTAGALFFQDNSNEVPDTVLNQAMEAPSLNNSLDLKLDFEKTDDNCLYYMTFYFTSMHSSTWMTGTNSFDIYIGGVHKATVLTEFSKCTSWTWVDARMNNTKVLNLEFRPNEQTSFPPAISAMEVFGANHGKKRNLGLIIGLPIGLVLGLPLLGLFIYFIVLRRKPRPVQARPAPQLTAHNGAIPGQGFDQEELDELLHLHFSLSNGQV
ncbi:hypothetical protein MLD38_017328 [Melastoma candidum]|uniref:Uncharacterized protein n=1 Tax=Melastoma candidum TaxID=119954 RepID=A0ACB9QQA0_9MYRT|nr:hypothetical protein MLD38_017328 [Melastoma candidum]